ncbi:hypothetical protein DPQ22_08575 [Candidatus Tokpelaia sp.]|nr:hypothetical protein DPQ22_08575 [Candidatus Tokpelaia sp.]
MLEIRLLLPGARESCLVGWPGSGRAEAAAKERWRPQASTSAGFSRQAHGLGGWCAAALCP